MVNLDLTNMQIICKKASDFNCMSCLFHIQYSEISKPAGKQPESFYSWENQVTEKWCDLPEFTLLLQWSHQEKFWFSSTSCWGHWASFFIDQWIVLVQRFSWHLCVGTTQNVICVYLVIPAFSFVLISGTNLPLFIIQSWDVPNLYR